MRADDHLTRFDIIEVVNLDTHESHHEIRASNVIDGEWVGAKFARELESELTAVKEDYHALSSLLDGHDCAECVMNLKEIIRERDDVRNRIAELESQRENWRMSSVCREKDSIARSLFDDGDVATALDHKWKED